MAVEHKEIQYAVGIEDLYICMQAEAGSPTEEPTFEEEVYAQTNITDVTISTNTASAAKWASNKKIINITKNSSFGLAFNLAGLNREVRDLIFDKVSKKGVSFENAKAKEYPKFAVGLSLPLSDGNKVIRWYPNCSITPTDESHATQTEEMEINDVAYTITADPLMYNDNTMAELDTGREETDGITAEQFLKQVVYDESQIETLFPNKP